MSERDDSLAGLPPVARAAAEKAMADFEVAAARLANEKSVGQQTASDAGDQAARSTLERERVLMRRALEVRAVVPDVIDEVIDGIDTSWEVEDDTLTITVDYPDSVEALMARREVHYRPGQAPV